MNNSSKNLAKRQKFFKVKLDILKVPSFDLTLK